MRSRSAAKRTVPKRLRKLLGGPPLVPFEDEDAYDALFSEFAVAYDPRDIVEWIYVREAVDLTWEIQRLRYYRTWIIDIERRYGLADIFGIIADKGDLTPEERFAAGAKMAAAYCDGDPDKKWEAYTIKNNQLGETKALVHFVGKNRDIRHLFKWWGFEEEGVCAIAFDRKIASMEALDRLIASSEARRNRTIREIENRRASAQANAVSPRVIDHKRIVDAPGRSKRRRPRP